MSTSLNGNFSIPEDKLFLGIRYTAVLFYLCMHRLKFLGPIRKDSYIIFFALHVLSSTLPFTFIHFIFNNQLLGTTGKILINFTLFRNKL